MKDKSLLVIEDDQEIRERLCEILAEEGYRVTSAAHGQEGLELLLQAEQLPALIIFDLMMPIMDGRHFRAAQLANPRTAAIPAVLITAGADPDGAACAVKAAAYLRKPFDLEQLFATVKRLVRAPR